MQTIEEFKDALYQRLEPYDKKTLNLMISGGSLLECLNEKRYSLIDTANWNIFFSDERLEQEYSNYKAASIFLDKIKGSVFPMEIKENCADDYEELLRKQQEQIDICLLGVGENGHICSIWPNSEILNSERLVEDVQVEANISPRRVTVTIAFINKFVKCLIFVIPPKNGKAKKVTKPDTSIEERLKISYEVLSAGYK
ncbi:hypothetical protein GINT2_001445 [Glugoides intestinalis]